MAAVVYITEHTDVGFSGAGSSVLTLPPSAVAQTPITASAVSQQSAAFNSATRFVKIKTDGGGPINYVFPTNPTAIAGSFSHQSANTETVHYVGAAAALKVAVIVSAA